MAEQAFASAAVPPAGVSDVASLVAREVASALALEPALAALQADWLVEEF